MRSVNKKKVRRRLIYAAILIFFIGVISVSALKVMKLVMEKEDAQLKLTQLEQEKARLEEELARVGSVEYIEQQAREQLNMIMPGETLYVLKGKDKENQQEKAEQEEEDEE